MGNADDLIIKNPFIYFGINVKILENKLLSAE